MAKKKMTIEDLAVIVDKGFKKSASDLESLALTTAKGFASVDERFKKMDERFDAMDERFDAMDERFDAMDERFDKLEFMVSGHGNRLDKAEDNIRVLKTAIAK